MDIKYKEKIEFKASEYPDKYKEVIKNIEKASLQTGITVEEGIKFLYHLSLTNCS
ncbi:hypothetical protein [Clostridium thailandense]|uniref:hypothetical protein n=1 Tax=Clostridium thailandense TaxID=2794346 RepID=UPI003988EFC9